MLLAQDPAFPGALLVVSGLLFLLLLVFLAAGASDVLRAADENERAALQEAVVRAAVHCYAVEGAYPESLADLEARYGLVYDKEKYLVDYRVFASNLMPDITVVPR